MADLDVIGAPFILIKETMQEIFKSLGLFKRLWLRKSINKECKDEESTKKCAEKCGINPIYY
jgi:hypothetical protein